jgi:hypothetical protein
MPGADIETRKKATVSDDIFFRLHHRLGIALAGEVAHLTLIIEVQLRSSTRQPIE